MGKDAESKNTYSLLIPKEPKDQAVRSYREIVLPYVAGFDELYSALGAILTAFPLHSKTRPFAQGLFAQTLSGPVWNIICDVLRFSLASPDFFRQGEHSVMSRTSKISLARINFVFFSILLFGATFAAYVSTLKDYTPGRFWTSDVAMGDPITSVVSDAAFGVGLLLAAWPQLHSMSSYYLYKKNPESFKQYHADKLEKMKSVKTLSEEQSSRIVARSTVFAEPADTSLTWQDALRTFQKNKWKHKNHENIKDALGNIIGFLGAVFGCVDTMTVVTEKYALSCGLFAISALIKWYQFLSIAFQPSMNHEKLDGVLRGRLDLSANKNINEFFSVADLHLLAKHPELLDETSTIDSRVIVTIN